MSRNYKDVPNSIVELAYKMMMNCPRLPEVIYHKLNNSLQEDFLRQRLWDFLVTQGGWIAPISKFEVSFFRIRDSERLLAMSHDILQENTFSCSDAFLYWFSHECEIKHIRFMQQQENHSFYRFPFFQCISGIENGLIIQQVVEIIDSHPSPSYSAVNTPHHFFFDFLNLLSSGNLSRPQHTDFVFFAVEVECDNSGYLLQNSGKNYDLVMLEWRSDEKLPRASFLREHPVADIVGTAPTEFGGRSTFLFPAPQ